MTVNQLAGGGPKRPNKLDFSPFLKHYQSSVLLFSLSGRQGSPHSSSSCCKPAHRGWESKPLLNLCSGLCKRNQPEKQPLPCCSPPAKTSLSAPPMNWATVHECKPASATLNFVSQSLWQTQRRMSERCRTLVTSVGCPLLFVISLSVVGWYSIRKCKYPHTTYLTNRMERCRTNWPECVSKDPTSCQANADVKLQILASCSSTLLHEGARLESPGINARRKQRVRFYPAELGRVWELI